MTATAGQVQQAAPPRGESKPRVRPASARAVQFVDIDWDGRRVRIEHRWINPHLAGAPLIVFLHEGLGSLAMWKRFPKKLCDAAGCRGLVYSRPGYGRSTPRAAQEAWGLDFMHRQAHQVLPALLAALGVDGRPGSQDDASHRPPPREANPPASGPSSPRAPVWLFGHSDGASIALLYAARHSDRLAGAVVVAPHIMVEEVSVASIQRARASYLDTDLRQRLAKYHDDPDSAFWGWNDIWLHPPFRRWSIEDEIASITCPLLAVQGLDDEYGTLEQIRGIGRRVPHTRLLELPDCRHSPHRDQPDALIAAATDFIQQHHSKGDNR